MNPPESTTAIICYGGRISEPGHAAELVEDWLDGRTDAVVSTYVRTSPDADGETLHGVKRPWADFSAAPGDTVLTVLTRDEAVVGDLSEQPYAVAPTILLALRGAPSVDRIHTLLDRIHTITGASYGFTVTVRDWHQGHSYAHRTGAILFRGLENPFAYVPPGADAEVEEADAAVPVADSARLRMVYEHTLLSRQHLAIDVSGTPLGEWISADPARGTVTKRPGGAILWDVAPEHVEELNVVLGEAGVLMSWFPRRR